jgi:glycosyltransferase involved in cell wall biosynthesis
LDHYGQELPGGRQRHIRDLAALCKNWGRDVVVVQKGRQPFETTCVQGVHVIGLRADLSAFGDFGFAQKAKRISRAGDVWLYASGENAWPFFSDNSKAIQHGVWWDCPQRALTRLVQRRRALGMMRKVRSVLCVDTNFINWLRAQGREAYELSSKCRFVPNYADIVRLAVTVMTPRDRLSLVTARRFEPKRGTFVFCEALSALRRTNVDFTAQVCTIGGREEVTDIVKRAGLNEHVRVTEESLDSILEVYQLHHIAVVPSLWSEGTSLACVEAIAAGLPVVATPVGGLGNLVIPGFNGAIEAPDPGAIARAVMSIWKGGHWETMHRNCLSMRGALGIDRWREQVREWLEA